MIKFLCLGSGSSGNCYLLQTPYSSILIDAGIGIRMLKKYAKEYGFSISSLDGVFITHDHADHIKAVGHISTDYNLPVYATELIHQGIVQNYCITTKIPEDCIKIVNKTVPVHVGDFVVTPFEVPHDSTDCVGYRVEVEGITFCLITDVGSRTPIIEAEVNRANYLVLEANHDEDMLMMGPYPAYLKGRIRSGHGHLCNKECGNLLAEHATPDLRRVWLCHLSEENNHPELARKTVDAILRQHGIIPGVDFQLDILKRKVPSGFCELV